LLFHVLLLLYYLTLTNVIVCACLHHCVASSFTFTVLCFDAENFVQI